MLPIKNNGNVINNKTWSDEVVTIRLGQTQRWNMPLPLGLFAYIEKERELWITKKQPWTSWSTWEANRTSSVL